MVNSNYGSQLFEFAFWHFIDEWNVWTSALDFDELWACAMLSSFSEASNLSFRSFGVGEAAASVRVVGADGAAANVGLLQVRMQGSHKNEFGSVCGMNLV